MKDVEENVLRVKSRVMKGGHDVPEEDIKRRYFRSIYNFWHVYKDMVGRWKLICNSTDKMQQVARWENYRLVINSNELFVTFKNKLKGGYQNE